MRTLRPLRFLLAAASRAIFFAEDDVATKMKYYRLIADTRLRSVVQLTGVKHGLRPIFARALPFLQEF